MAKKPLKGFPKSDAQKMLDRLSAPRVVQKYASGGLTGVPVTAPVFMLSSDKKKQADIDRQLKAYEQQVNAYNQRAQNYNAAIQRGITQEAYYNLYPDVRNAGVDAFQHYMDYGYREGRKMPGFDPAYYLRTYKDVAADPVFGSNPFLHYARHGAGEGRSPIEGPGAVPNAPMTQDQVNSFAADAQRRAIQNAAQRATALRVVQDPRRFNLSSFGLGETSGVEGANLAGMSTPMFNEGGEVAKESFASKALKEVIPLDTRTFVSTLFGNRDPITEQNLSSDQLSALREVIQTAEQKGRQGNVQYSDYSKFKEGPQHNPHISLENTLGRFNYVQNPDGSITVTDRYDFVNPQREEAIKTYEGMGPARKALEVAKRTLQKPATLPLTLASELGNAYIGREGRDVKIKLPPSDSKKMLDGVKKPQKK